MIPARACGTIRTVRPSTRMTTTAMTIRTMAPADMDESSLLGDERRGALDLQDIYSGTHLDHMVIVERSRGPGLAADLDEAVVGIDSLEHGRACAHERRGSGAGVRGRAQVT